MTKGQLVHDAPRETMPRIVGAQGAFRSLVIAVSRRSGIVDQFAEDVAEDIRQPVCRAFLRAQMQAMINRITCGFGQTHQAEELVWTNAGRTIQRLVHVARTKQASTLLSLIGNIKKEAVRQFP